MTVDWTYWVTTIIGAGIGFAVSIGLIVVQRLFDKIGKLKIYCVTVRGLKANDGIGFARCTFSGKQCISFMVPVKIEIQNTSNSARVIRDLSMWLYRDGKPVIEMIQLQNTEHKETENGHIVNSTTNEYGGDKNMYSFIAPPRSIQRVHCSYIAEAEENNVNKFTFNELRMAYYDEKDKKHVLFLKAIEGTWKTGLLNGDDDWILLREEKTKKKKRYHPFYHPLYHPYLYG